MHFILELRQNQKSEGKKEAQFTAPQARIKYRPYPKPRTIEVSLKDKGKENLPVSYQDIPRPAQDLKREKIKLPSVDLKKLKQARSIADLLCNYFKNQGIKSLTNDEFSEIYNRFTSQDDFDSSDQELKCLATVLCVKSPKNRKGKLANLPDEFLNSGNMVRKVRILTRYAISVANNIGTAADLENVTSFKKVFQQAGLSRILKIATIKDALNIAYIGWLHGEVPPIRLHKLSINNKWTFRESEDSHGIPESAIVAARNIFLEQPGVITPDGYYCAEKIQEINWSEVYNSKSNGFRGAFNQIAALDGALDALDVAAPGLIGIDLERGQIPAWRFRRLIPWRNPHKATQYMNDLTRFVCTRIQKVVDSQGNPIPCLVRKAERWENAFSSKCRSAFVNSGITSIWGAFQSAYPNAIGWKNDQVNPGDILFIGMWDGKEGLNLFKNRFAKAIYELCEALKEADHSEFANHQVQFLPDHEHPLKINKQDLQKVKRFLLSNSIHWAHFIDRAGLSKPFIEIADTSIVKTFELMLGKINKRTDTLGKTAITRGDVIDKKVAHGVFTTTLLEELDTRYKIKNLAYGISVDDLESVGRQAIGPIKALKQCRDAIDTTLSAQFYTSYSDTILPKVLYSKDQHENFIVTDRAIGVLLRIIRDHLLDETDLPDEAREKVKQVINNLFEHRAERTI